MFALIHASGLERFYDLRRGPGVPPLPQRDGGFPWLASAFPGADAATSGPELLALDIQGITCAACVWILESLFRKHEAGAEIRINPALGQVDLYWDPSRGDVREWLREAEAFGYRFAPRLQKPASGASRALLVRLGITVAAAMNVMIFTLCYYLGLTPADGLLFPLFGWLNLLLATIALVAGGWVFLRGAVLGIRRRLVHLDLPIAAGILLAYGGSVIEHLRHGPEAAYYDTVTIFIALMLVGRWLQERVLERNRNALLGDPGIDTLFVRRYRDGDLESIPAAEVSAGDEIWVVPGDVVPVDGEILEQPAWLRMDWITGESREQRVEMGKTVSAGAINAGRTAVRLVAREGFATSRLRGLLGTSSETKPEAPGWWQRISWIYVTTVFALSTAGFLMWLSHGVDRAIQVAVAILVVTCPCALGLAVPLAHELTHLSLRRRGIFLRGRSFLERALSVRKILFDKTGTLTLSGLTLDPPSRRALETLAPEDRGVLSALARQSNHPVSRALAEALEREGSSPSEANGTGGIDRKVVVRETTGGGLEADFGGRVYRLGSPTFALSPGNASRGDDTSAADAITAETGGDSGSDLHRAVFTVDGRTVAGFRFVEQIKEDVPEELERLKGAGYDVYLVSGDGEERVNDLARALRIGEEHFRGAMNPEAKAEWIRDLDRRDTLMVGDGINDGPGFDAAHCTATPAVDHPSLPGRCDFYFLGTGIGAVGETLRAARRLRRVLRGNLAVAAGYNLVALSLCFLGTVTPVVAAVLMPLSSVAVVSLTAYRLSGGRA